jgi:parallel beta-helix repeat protein
VLFAALGAGPAAAAWTIYVDIEAIGANDGSSWTDAYNHLQDALAEADSVANPGNIRIDSEPVEVKVARGVYKPDRGANQTPGDREATFRLANDVALKGGYAGAGGPEPNARDIRLYETILSGDLAGDDISWTELLDIRARPLYSFDEPNREDNTQNVVTGSGTDETALLDGFTVSNGTGGRGAGMYNDAGSPTVRDCTFTRNWTHLSGGGIYCENNSNPTLVNCIISRNWALVCGGMHNSGSNPSLTNCVFTENFAHVNSGVIVERGYRQHGGMLNSDSNPTLINCVFIDNFHAAMSNFSSSPTLLNCVFTGNEGGVDNYDKSSPTVTSCTFTENEDEGMTNSGASCPILTSCIFTRNDGGGMANYGQSNPILTNCIFVGNSTRFGAGMYNGSGSYPTLANCTLAGNRATSGAVIHGGNPVLVNCIMWSNTSPQIIADASVSFSNIQGGWPGEGNIAADPLLVDAAGPDGVYGTEDDDLRLLTGSACIDAGDNPAVPPSVVADVDGNPRFVNGVVDMGAYESPLPELLLSTNLLVVPEGNSATFTVALIDPRSSAVEVTIARRSGDPDIIVESGARFFFDASNYSVPQTVVLAALEDGDNIGSESQIRITTADGLVAIVTAVEADNEAFSNVLFVDDDAAGNGDGTTWTDAFTNLQEALSAAATIRGIEEIRVAQGMYRPDRGLAATPEFDRRDATFQLIRGVALKGGYAGAGEPEPDARDVARYETVLSGDLNGDDIRITDPYDLLEEPSRGDNSYVVVGASGTDETTALDGFTITAGNDNRFLGSGAGISNSYGSPSIANCTLSNNAAYSGGAMSNYAGHPTLANCTFTANCAEHRGGGMRNSSSNPILINCTFSGNSAYYYGGGGMNSYDSHPVLTNCTFSANLAHGNFGEGGGIYNEMSSPTLTDCMFVGNSATDGFSAAGGGMYNAADFSYVDGSPTYFGSKPILTNCIFAGNSAKDGAGMHNRYSDPILNNCTFSGNVATSSGGGMYNKGSGTRLSNCTFAQNSAPEGSALARFPGSHKYPGNVELNSCVIWGDGNEIWGNRNFGIAITNSDVRGGWPGEGNIDTDPLFAASGYWDTNGTPGNTDDDFWVDGDYHLKSRFGRYDPITQAWVTDDVTSPCIDAGDLTRAVGLEPSPNGGVINMGAYGGTAEASMSPSGELTIATHYRREGESP